MPKLDGPLSFDFSDAPGGDQSLDDLFPGDETVSTTTEPTSATSEAEASPATDEPFLKTATGTVYKSVDDAVKGIEHKDALIAQLRQQVAEKTGTDPIKRQPEVEESYLSQPKKYFEDIQKAKSEQELIAIQSRFIQENLAPYLPYVQSAAKARALEEVSTEVPEIQKFLKSEDYQKTLDAYPLLKQSVAIAESNPQAAVDLGQLYKMAHSMSLGMNLPKIVQSAAKPQAETRPTVSSTPVTPPQAGQVIAKPTLATQDGRKAIQAEQEAKGVLNLRF